MRKFDGKLTRLPNCGISGDPPDKARWRGL